MVVFLRNNQKVLSLATSELCRDAELLLRAAGDWCTAFDVSVTLLDDVKMRQVNKRYHRKNKTTDILSFPYYPKLTPGTIPKAKTIDSCELGDIYLGVEKINLYSQENQISLQSRLRYLMAHGICHLLGHWHNNDESHKKMLDKEAEMLNILKEIRGRERT